MSACILRANPNCSKRLTQIFWVDATSHRIVHKLVLTRLLQLANNLAETVYYRPIMVSRLILIQTIVRKISLAIIFSFVIGFCALATRECRAQRPRFPDFFQLNQAPAQPYQIPARPVQFQTPNSSPPSLTTPNFGSPSIINSPPIITTTPPPAVFQTPPQNMYQSPGVITTPTFDPFQTNNLPLPDFGGQVYNPIQVQPPPQYPSPQFPTPQYGVNNQLQYGTEGRNWWPSAEWPSQAWAKLRQDLIPRLLERPRLRQTYITGNGGDQLGMNESELATTLTFPNFLKGTQPLRVSPNFIFYFLSGPSTAVTGVDLPSKVYSTFLSFDFMSNPAFTGGVETNFAVGFYSDFSAANSNSIRYTGTLLGWQRINSYTTGKLGIEYYDRVDIKLLPAVGVFLTPIPDLKLDIYFPRPKLAQRIPNIGSFEVWTYVGAEYGGGSWTIERTAGFEDQVDINQVEFFVGLEWLGPRGVTGFSEIGYVFDRELVYRSDSQNKTELQDAFMVRMGAAF